MLKGHSILELTDVNTGQKMVTEQDNMVTNALRDLYETRLATTTAGLELGWSDMKSTALGGILLMDNTVAENPDNIFLPRGVNCVGYASNDAYAGANNFRGSVNSNETEVLSNGVKFVWDFATNQANGSIKCLALTSAMGGKIGYGSDDPNEQNRPVTRLSKNNVSMRYNDEYSYNNMHYTENGKHYFVCAQWGLDGFQVKRMRWFDSEISITRKWGSTGEFQTYTLGVTSACPNSSKNNLYCCGYNDGNFYFGICYGKMYLFAVARDFSRCTEYSFDASPYYDAIVDGDYIYLLVNISNAYKVRKYAYKTGELVKEISCPSYRSDIDGITGKINGMKYFRNFLLDEDDNVRYLYNGSGSSVYDDYTVNMKHVMDIGVDGSSAYKVVFYSYLATINNLATPVVKTSAQTMKITYTLTESEA